MEEKRTRRLYIERIIVENFKSYKGEHVIGPFGRKFNTVVGPNGSGKSNVIDAILFVLGFKAKKLRHSRAEDLIHSGEPKPGKATVTIELKDDQNESVSVSRTVNKAGKSTYTINNEMAVQDRVTELMKMYNVDLANNRFMILQGEIESISNMKPKGSGDQVGLVEYLEEIIGTNQLIDKIKAAEDNLRTATELADRYRAEYQFIEKEVGYLEPKAEAARTRIGSYLSGISKRVSIISEERKESSEALEALLNQKKQSDLEIEEVKQKKNEVLNIQKSAEAEEEQAKSEFRKKEQIFLEVKSKYESIDIRNRKVQELIKIHEGKKLSLQQEIHKIKEEKKVQEEKKKNSKEEKEENDLKINNGQSERDKIILDIQKVEESMNGSDKVELERSQKQLLDHMRSAKGVKDSLREKTKERESIELKKSKIEKCTQEIPQEIKRVRESACVYSEDKYIKHEKKLCELKKIREDTIIELRKRENLLSEVQSEMRTSNVTDKLSEHLQIEGYHGRLKDLGSIPDKYTMALSAVAKGSLNNLVVDTTRIAEKCLDIIKSKNLGRHTIIVLDKIISDIKQSKECNRLLDKIRTKDLYKKCFYHVLGDTLVVNNMEAAMKRAFAPDRPKVVTLDGKVIDRSGLMSGGAVRPVILSQRRTQKEINKELKEAQASVKEAQDGLRLVEAAIEKTTIKLEAETTHKKNKEKSESEIISLEKQLATAQEEMKTLPDLEIQYKKIKENENTLIKKIKALNQTESELEETIRKYQTVLDEIGGSSYKTMKARLAGLEEQIFTLQTRNKQLQKYLNEPLISPQEKESQLEDVIRRLNEFVLEPINKEQSDMELSERELREVKSKVSTAEDKRISMQREIDIYRIKETELEERITVADENIKLIHKKLDQIGKEEHNIKGIEKGITEKLGSHKNSIEESTEYIKDTITQEEVTAEIEVYLTYQNKKSQAQKENDQVTTKESEERKAKDSLMALKEERSSKFMSSIKQINTELKKIYSMLTFGGDAEIEPVDYLDPFSEGVIMSVMPPRKSWKSISHLSGGERTLASLSLIFALHEYHPNSFYVMDEIDAALDYKNVGIVGQFIQERSNDCQFLVISLRENMYELADVFIGVYRPAESTLTLAVNMNINV
ncbi:structural maintenance of chromosome 4 [Nematocida parisii]|nr:structural maintenance of chromosome 4 [Nematocida parisii]KAI5131125.1 structural maintenance of chromosome 4 [Nematocida parisii]KAI5141340.1 structural maintenance of chromosome 4 [Nematocida parisii]